MKSFKKIIILLSIPFLSFFELLANEKKLEVFTLIESSEATLKILDKNTDLKDFKNYLSKCRAVLIFPEVYEGGFIFGAKGGNGILLIKKGEEFTGPFFYSLGGLSFGLQAGAKSGRVVMTVMTHRGLKSILKERVKLGVDVDAVVVEGGVGYSAESTIRLADIYSFSDNKGLFLGTSIEGSYLQPRNDFNKIIHKKALSADDILRADKPNAKVNDLKKIISRITKDVKK
jgi:lipid-binding SYLF domain-containing protein|tara:strand:- start:10832 stop:11521 length:690 start_codon:yes stop_codon:yes gene_type:complete